MHNFVNVQRRDCTCGAAVCHTVLKSKKTVSVYLKSKQLLTSRFARQHTHQVGPT